MRSPMRTSANEELGTLAETVLSHLHLSSSSDALDSGRREGREGVLVHTHYSQSRLSSTKSDPSCQLGSRKVTCGLSSRESYQKNVQMHDSSRRCLKDVSFVSPM